MIFFHSIPARAGKNAAVIKPLGLNGLTIGLSSSKRVNKSRR
jgi:hypothetical protein